MADLSPREQMRQKIEAALAELMSADRAASGAEAVARLFHRVREDIQDIDTSTMMDTHEQLLRQRTIVAEMHGTADPHPIKGRYRGGS